MTQAPRTIAQRQCPNVPLTQAPSNESFSFSFKGVPIASGDRVSECNAKAEPDVRWTPAPNDARAYTIIMVDPDASEDSSTQWLHWAEINIPFGSVNGHVMSEYQGPTPPRGTHRYCTYLIKQHHAIRSDSDDFIQLSVMFQSRKDHNIQNTLGLHFPGAQLIASHEFFTEASAAPCGPQHPEINPPLDESDPKSPTNSSPKSSKTFYIIIGVLGGIMFLAAMVAVFFQRCPRRVVVLQDDWSERYSSDFRSDDGRSHDRRTRHVIHNADSYDRSIRKGEMQQVGDTSDNDVEDESSDQVELRINPETQEIGQDTELEAEMTEI